MSPISSSSIKQLSCHTRFPCPNAVHYIRIEQSHRIGISGRFLQQKSSSSAMVLSRRWQTILEYVPKMIIFLFQWQRMKNFRRQSGEMLVPRRAPVLRGTLTTFIIYSEKKHVSSIRGTATVVTDLTESCYCSCIGAVPCWGIIPYNNSRSVIRITCSIIIIIIRVINARCYLKDIWADKQFLIVER